MKLIAVYTGSNKKAVAWLTAIAVTLGTDLGTKIMELLPRAAMYILSGSAKASSGPYCHIRNLQGVQMKINAAQRLTSTSYGDEAIVSSVKALWKFLSPKGVKSTTQRRKDGDKLDYYCVKGFLYGSDDLYAEIADKVAKLKVGKPKVTQTNVTTTAWTKRSSASSEMIVIRFSTGYANRNQKLLSVTYKASADSSPFSTDVSYNVL